MPEYSKNTVVLITTDHGRGDHPSSFHNHIIYEAKNVWMYIMGPYIQSATKSNGVFERDHSLDHGIIRPLVETIMGMNPIYPGSLYSGFMDEYIFEN